MHRLTRRNFKQAYERRKNLHVNQPFFCCLGLSFLKIKFSHTLYSMHRLTRRNSKQAYKRRKNLHVNRKKKWSTRTLIKISSLHSEKQLSITLIIPKFHKHWAMSILFGCIRKDLNLGTNAKFRIFLCIANSSININVCEHLSNMLQS